MSENNFKLKTKDIDININIIHESCNPSPQKIKCISNYLKEYQKKNISRSKL